MFFCSSALNKPERSPLLWGHKKYQFLNLKALTVCQRLFACIVLPVGLWDAPLWKVTPFYRIRHKRKRSKHLHIVEHLCNNTILNPAYCWFTMERVWLHFTETHLRVILYQWKAYEKKMERKCKTGKHQEGAKSKSLRISLKTLTEYKWNDNLCKIHKGSVFFLLQIHISDILFRKGYCTSNRKINEALKKNIGLEAAPEILSRICE